MGEVIDHPTMADQAAVWLLSPVVVGEPHREVAATCSRCQRTKPSNSSRSLSSGPGELGVSKVTTPPFISSVAFHSAR